jgi:hypothetical protein
MINPYNSYKWRFNIFYLYIYIGAFRVETFENLTRE